MDAKCWCLDYHLDQVECECCEREHRKPNYDTTLDEIDLVLAENQSISDRARQFYEESRPSTPQAPMAPTVVLHASPGPFYRSEANTRRVAQLSYYRTRAAMDEASIMDENPERWYPQ